jgi:hypothetical protein
MELHRELNTLKKTPVPWMDGVSKCAPQEALRDLDRAFVRFFSRVKLEKGGKLKGKLGDPKGKGKKTGPSGFRLTGTIIVFPDAIQLPRLRRLRLKERGYLPPCGVKVRSAAVTEHAGHWFVAVLVEREHVVPENTGPVVGVDLHIKRLATPSDGGCEQNPPTPEATHEKDQASATVCRQEEAWEPEPREGRPKPSRAAPTSGELTCGLVASIHLTIGEHQANRGDRRPERVRHAEQPYTGANHRRCGILRIPAPAGVQSCLVRVPGYRSRSMVSMVSMVCVFSHLLVLRVGKRGFDALRSHVCVSQSGSALLWPRDGPRPECRYQLSQAGRQFSGQPKRLWRGQRWPGWQHSGETAPSEARTGHVSSPRGIKR